MKCSKEQFPNLYIIIFYPFLSKLQADVLAEGKCSRERFVVKEEVVGKKIYRTRSKLKGRMKGVNENRRQFF